MGSRPALSCTADLEGKVHERQLGSTSKVLSNSVLSSPHRHARFLSRSVAILGARLQFQIIGQVEGLRGPPLHSTSCLLRGRSPPRPPLTAPTWSGPAPPSWPSSLPLHARAAPVAWPSGHTPGQPAPACMHICARAACSRVILQSNPHKALTSLACAADIGSSVLAPSCCCAACLAMLSCRWVPGRRGEDDPNRGACPSANRE